MAAPALVVRQVRRPVRLSSAWLRGDCAGVPKVIYVSTDCRSPSAPNWNDFGLTHPKLKSRMIDAAYRGCHTVDELGEIWKSDYLSEQAISILSVSPMMKPVWTWPAMPWAPPHVYFWISPETAVMIGALSITFLDFYRAQNKSPICL